MILRKIRERLSRPRKAFRRAPTKCRRLGIETLERRELLAIVVQGRIDIANLAAAGVDANQQRLLVPARGAHVTVGHEKGTSLIFRYSNFMII
jgi:hypothetical protein